MAEIGPKRATYWLTGSSTPCISIFKPYWLIDHQLPMVFSETETDQALAFWHLRETLHRMVLSRQIDLDAYLEKRDQLQHELFQTVSSLDVDNADPKTLAEVMEYGLAAEAKLVTETINEAEDKPARIKGNPYFRHYWRKQNRGLNPAKEVVP